VSSGKQRIGFIGVGMMGHGMAKNLVEKGFPTAVLGHKNRAPVEDLVKRGAREAKNPADAANGADVVFLCVSGSPQVEEIVYEASGLLSAARKGLFIVDCSTSEPESTTRIARDFAGKGVSFIDAPLRARPRKQRRAGST
jgi:3-hydroxyisobutyrate dehydrogenase-like beta-hydroxyacid dehydrogenase